MCGMDATLINPILSRIYSRISVLRMVCIDQKMTYERGCIEHDLLDFNTSKLL